MNTARIQPLDAMRWRELARNFRDYNYRQIWGFGMACAARLGATSEHVGVAVGTDIIGLADARIRRTPLLRTGIAYINGGPLVRQAETGDPERLATVLECLQHTFVHERQLLLRIAPSPAPPAWNARQQEVYLRLGFRQPDDTRRNQTIMVDLSRPPPEMRLALDPTWRNQLRQAERNGLNLCSGTGDELFTAFCRLYAQLIDRKQFAVDLNAEFYAQVQRELADDERFEITLAEVGGEPVAGHVAALQGDTGVYLLGASAAAGLTTKASFLLHWGALLRAQARGYRWYDLGGIDPVANPGVYKFKRRMGGVELTAPGPFEAAPDEVRRMIVRSGERVYRALHARLKAAT